MISGWGNQSSLGIRQCNINDITENTKTFIALVLYNYVYTLCFLHAPCFYCPPALWSSQVVIHFTLTEIGLQADVPDLFCWLYITHVVWWEETPLSLDAAEVPLLWWSISFVRVCEILNMKSLPGFAQFHSKLHADSYIIYCCIFSSFAWALSTGGAVPIDEGLEDPSLPGN